jgi:hypothetical protein
VVWHAVTFRDRDGLHRAVSDGDGLLTGLRGGAPGSSPAAALAAAINFELAFRPVRPEKLRVANRPGKGLHATEH